MPHAFADPTVMSTVTTNTVSSEGVAGSTNGTTATITVGTTGGGASPEIYYLAGGHHRPTFVAGAWRKVSLTDGTIQFMGTNAGGKAIVNSGTIGGAIGAYAWLEHGGTAKISGAEVTIKNCTFKLDGTAPEPQWGIIGGLAVSEEGDGGGKTRGVAEVAHSKVTIEGGTYNVPEGGNITVAGGAAYAQTKSVNSTAAVTDSEASITGGSFPTETKLYGGKAKTESEARSEAKALRNSLTFTTGDTVTEIYGGYAKAHATKTSISLQANENHLTAKAGADKFYGGYAYAEQQAGATRVSLNTAQTNGNIVTIAAGSGTFKFDSAGGYNTLRTEKAAAVTTAANANQLTIAGGTFKETVFGGKTSATNDDATGTVTATARNNELWANGGTFQRKILVGEGSATTKAGAATTIASENKLHLADTAAFPTDGTAVYITGGDASVRSETGKLSLTTEKNSIDGTLTSTTSVVRGADGNLEQLAATGGQAITASAAENTVTLTGGKAYQVYGSQLTLSKAAGAADLHAAKNSVVLTNAASERGSSAAFRGSYIEAHDAKGSLQIRAEENTVTADGAVLDVNDMYGSHVRLRNSNAGTTEATVTANHALMRGKKADTLAGGYADIISFENAALTVKLTGNTAEVQSGTAYDAYGAHAKTTQKDGAGEVTAEGNTITLTKLTADGGSFTGAKLVYRRDGAATAAGDTMLIAGSNKADLNEGKLSKLFGAEIRIDNAFGGPTTYTATENTATIEAKGVVTSSAYDAYLSQENFSEDGTSFTADIAKNTVTSTGGAVKDAHGALASLKVNNAGDAAATLTENAVTGTGGTFAGDVRGGVADVIAETGTATAAHTKNTVNLTNAKLDDTRIQTGYAEVITKAAGKTASAAAHENVLLLKNASGTVQELIGGVASGTAERAGAAAAADKNSVTAEGGTLTAASDVYGGTVGAVGKDAPVTASASENTVTLSAAAPWRQIRGGRVRASADGAAATATASKNTLNLAYGTFTSEINGGYAIADGAPAQATANENTVNISGGIYQHSIYAGAADAGSTAGSVATVKDNRIVITGTPNLSAAQLHGYKAVGATKNIAGNALVVKETKGIKAKSIDGFQKLDFWLPVGMTKDDTMLWLSSTSNTDLTGTEITAHLRGDETEKRLRLLYTEKAQIQKDGTTTMTVWKGVSDVTTAKIGITEDNKELIVKTDGSGIDEGDKPTPKPPTPDDLKRQAEDNRKSVVETMAGAAALLGAGADLMTGGGMASASVEAAAAPGFAPFAAIGGSSMRHETGSHVDMKGMNLAVGFSREVTRGDNRLIFGPIVEYGRGTYDSYVNDAHGDGSVRYIGGGAFVRQEQKDGLFYEGSLRFGRSSMDYSTPLTSYNTDANYIGAHLGFGQRVTEQSGNERELYVRYFYTRQNGTSAKLSTGERYDFDAVQSQRLRTGARWTIPQKGGSFIVGASIQYELGGDANATVHVGGLSYTTPSPSLKGFSGSLELGWKAPIGKNATADLSVEGWAGKQRGISFNAGFNWKF